MKSYKIRSLIYLGCFITAAVFYYNFEQQISFQSQILNSETVETEFEDAPQVEQENPEQKDTLNN